MMSSSDEYESAASETTIGHDGIEPHGETYLDGVAVKPAEMSIEEVHQLPFERITIDYEGPEHFPTNQQLATLAAEREVRITIPVRADGFDPLGDYSRIEALPEGLQSVLVAGHPAYLSETERKRAIAPRFKAALDLVEDAWVGTEGIERLALATGATQFELLSDSTHRDIRGLRAAGYDGTIAVYAPTVMTEDDDAILDAIGGYVSRRKPVAKHLPAGAATDSRAEGRTRSVLLAAARDYALVGSPEEIREQVTELRELGADAIIGYLPRGLTEFDE